jgi:hypothetical protein
MQENAARGRFHKQMKRTLAAAAIIASLLSACAPPAARREGGDAAPAASANPFAELNALAREAAALKNPLAQYEFYRARYESSQGVTHGYLGQVLAASAAELGAYDKAVLLYPQGAPLMRRPPADLPDAAHLHPVAAADGIAELARSRRIVMVNEAHHDAHTRVLTLALLPRLRALGFTHFAAESLSEYDRDLAARGYPVKGSGPYVAEPLYAEIIRTALRLGFTVVAYESASTQTEGREEEQAQHLADRVFRAQADARLFVHGGYAHVHKQEDYLGTETMAMRLERKTGFDPLVVDQTVLRPGAPGREYADYRQLLQTFPVDAPTIFVAGDGKSAWSLEPRFYDVSVLLPPTRLVYGRPDWLALGGAREAVAVGLDLQPESLPCVLEARYAGEGDAAIPADRALVERSGDPVVLFLRPGEYRVAAVTSGGRVFGAQRLRVAVGSGARIPSPAPSR